MHMHQFCHDKFKILHGGGSTFRVSQPLAAWLPRDCLPQLICPNGIMILQPMGHTKITGFV